MKNKTDFFIENDIPKKHFLDQKETGPTDALNQYLAEEQKSSKKSFDKVIKGKVKVYHNNCKPKFLDHKHMNNESELALISDRMLQFLKFVSLLFILVSLFILFKKYS